tara:strand:+ start:719 stop:1222 length:504 start_codon:yes stop_codon:yes gene_type:complete
MTRIDDERRLDLITYEIEKKAHQTRNKAAEYMVQTTEAGWPEEWGASSPGLQSLRDVSKAMVWNCEAFLFEAAKASAYWELFQQTECSEDVRDLFEWLKQEHNRLAYQASRLPSCTTSRMLNLEQAAQTAARNQIHVEVTAICERVRKMGEDDVRSACAEYEAECAN